MKNHKISVIIPVYNAEKTVGNILEKLISQKYRNIEVIVVNDGSQDDSRKVLQKFAKKDERIIAIDQKNAGASAARNVGIEKATGEFITFIDSDDDISDKLISELASRVKNNPDFIMSGMSINGKRIITPEVFLESHKAIVSYVLKSLLTKNLFYGPYCKLFRRSVIEEFDIKFPEKVKYGEDTIFVLCYLGKVKNIAVVSESLYLYNYRPSGLAATNNSDLSFRRARTKELNKFVSDKLSIRILTLYLCVRTRWALAMIKSRLRAGL